MGHGINKETAKEAEEQGLVSASVVCKRLNISRRTLGRMVRMKELVPSIIGGVNFFDPNDIEEFTLDPDSIKEDREYVLEYALDTLQAQSEHIDKLINLAHKPAQETINALLSENNSLRKRAQEQERTVVEVHELYGQLLRESLMTEIEAERERSKLKMREDAMGVLKDKLIPIILENMGSNRFIDSFTDEQIEAFIESGAANGAQAATLRKTLEKRKKKAGTNATHSQKPNEKSVSDSTE